MAQFDAAWLCRREPFDHAARSIPLTQQMIARLPERSPLRIMDLGCGLGSNYRYLQPRMERASQWILIDHDADLLQHAQELGVSGTFYQWELTHLENLRKLYPVDLITGSALLDLVSAEWVAALVGATGDNNTLFFFTLTYDGRQQWQPAHPLDEWIRVMFHRHMQQDKGLGIALGARAVPTVCQILKNKGFTVHTGDSDWQITPADTPMLTALVTGISLAVQEICPPGQQNRLQTWRRVRKHQMEHQELSLIVGHQDLLAYRERQ